MTKIFNGTPHAINVIDNGTFDAAIRKHVTDNPNVVASIPSNGMLSAKVSTVDADPINGIPVFEKAFTGVDPLPEGFDVYIVSAMYGSAAKAVGMDTSRMFTVADPVYSTDGKTIHGCKGICPVI